MLSNVVKCVKTKPWWQWPTIKLYVTVFSKRQVWPYVNNRSIKMSMLQSCDLIMAETPKGWASCIFFYYFLILYVNLKVISIFSYHRLFHFSLLPRKYKLQYKKKSPSWSTVCNETPHRSCDLTAVGLHYLGIYVLRVRANMNRLHSNWVEKEFCPDKDGEREGWDKVRWKESEREWGTLDVLYRGLW